MIFEEKIISSFDGTELFCRIKESGAKRWLIATHGIGEHSGRHIYVSENLSSHYNICLYDLRGHGKSEGRKGYVKSFSEYKKDLLQIIEFLKQEYRLSLVSLFGHSMGALIVSDFIQTYGDSLSNLEKIFLSAPPVSPGGIGGLVARLSPNSFAHLLTQIPFSFKTLGLVDSTLLSHDPRVHLEYQKDPLNNTRLETALLIALVDACKDVYSRPLENKVPVYCIIGTGDKVVHFPSVKNFFNEAPNTIFKEIEDGYHELHNEIAKYREPYVQFLKKSLIESI